MHTHERFVRKTRSLVFNTMYNCQTNKHGLNPFGEFEKFLCILAALPQQELFGEES